MNQLLNTPPKSRLPITSIFSLRWLRSALPPPLAFFLAKIQNVTRWLSGIFSSRWFLSLLCLSGFGLRLAGLANDPLWYDEAVTRVFANSDLFSMIRATAGDTHPPLFYLVDWALVRVIGDSSFALRIASAVAGTWLIYELYRLARPLLGELEARGGAVVLTFLPAFLNYSQEARSYSIYSLLIVATLRSVIERRWQRAWILAALTAYSHNIGIIYVGLIALVGLTIQPKQALLMSARAFIAYLPWLPVAIKQVATVKEMFWTLPVTLGAIPQNLIFNTLYVRFSPEMVLPATALGCVMLGAAPVILWRTLAKSWPLVLLGFGPVATLVAISSVWRPILVDRTLLPSGAMHAALWGASLVHLARSNRYALLAIFAPMLAASAVSFYVWDNPYDYNVKDSVPIIRAAEKPCDVIYHMTVSSYTVLDPDKPLPMYLAPFPTDLGTGLTNETKQAIGIKSAPIDELARHYCRAWLYDTRTATSNPREHALALQIIGEYPVLASYHLVDNRYADASLYLVDLSHAR